MNEGKFMFIDVTDKAGIYSSSLGYGLALSTYDINNDGFIDVYVGNDFHENDYLYLNNGDKTFEEVSNENFTSTSRFTMGVDISDINGDLIQDIFTLDMMPNNADIFLISGGEDSDKVSQIKRDYGYGTQFARNHMHLGSDQGYFKEVALITETYASDWSWSVLLEDFNNDSMVDIFVSNGIYKRPNDLDFINYKSSLLFENYRNREEDQFEKDLINQMPTSKLSNIVFLQGENFSFESLTKSAGIPPSYSNGSAVSDLDNDGDLDLVSNNINEDAQILENKSERLKNSFVQFDVQNEKGSQALGAKLTVYSEGKKLFKEVAGIRGFASTSSTRVHYGLGNAETIDSLKVTWITGRSSTYYNIEINELNEITPLTANSSKPMDVSEKRKFEIKPLGFVHEENYYLDYEREPLIPERLSTEGPAYIGGDFNGDGIKDIFIGGAKSQSSQIFSQNTNGVFTPIQNISFTKDALFEDVDAEAFDFDLDGDLDIYVSSGGNEYIDGDNSLMDRLYINNGMGHFHKFPANLPSTNGGSISSSDFNNDGYSDLFIGSRSMPGGYGLSPISVIVESAPDSNSYFKVVAQAPLGMITDSQFADLNDDGIMDLVVVGDWMPVTILIGQGENQFSNETSNFGLGQSSGFWNSVEIADINNDGKLDILAGNSGENHKWRATSKSPIEIYLDDFDDNSSVDPIIFYNFFGTPVPFASRDKLVHSLPYLKKKFVNYRDFTLAKNIITLTGRKQIFETKNVSEMRSMAFIQNEAKKFTPVPLPKELQYSTIEDFYVDENKIYYIGNYSGFVSEIGSSLSNAGGVLVGFDGNDYVSHHFLPLPINFEGRHIDKVNHDTFIVVGNNSESYLLKPKLD